MAPDPFCCVPWRPFIIPPSALSIFELLTRALRTAFSLAFWIPDLLIFIISVKVWGLSNQRIFKMDHGTDSASTSSPQNLTPSTPVRAGTVRSPMSARLTPLVCYRQPQPPASTVNPSPGIASAAFYGRLDLDPMSLVASRPAPKPPGSPQDSPASKLYSVSQEPNGIIPQRQFPRGTQKLTDEGHGRSVLHIMITQDEDFPHTPVNHHQGNVLGNFRSRISQAAERTASAFSALPTRKAKPEPPFQITTPTNTPAESCVATIFKGSTQNNRPSLATREYSPIVKLLPIDTSGVIQGQHARMESSTSNSLSPSHRSPDSPSPSVECQSPIKRMLQGLHLTSPKKPAPARTNGPEVERATATKDFSVPEYFLDLKILFAQLDFIYQTWLNEIIEGANLSHHINGGVISATMTTQILWAGPLAYEAHYRVADLRTKWCIPRVGTDTFVYPLLQREKSESLEIFLDRLSGEWDKANDDFKRRFKEFLNTEEIPGLAIDLIKAVLDRLTYLLAEVKSLLRECGAQEEGILQAWGSKSDELDDTMSIAEILKTQLDDIRDEIVANGGVGTPIYPLGARYLERAGRNRPRIMP
ncbi:hypothetical protein RUND412_006905 [Rhizina undulata]